MRSQSTQVVDSMLKSCAYYDTCVMIKNKGLKNKLLMTCLHRVERTNEEPRAIKRETERERKREKEREREREGGIERETERDTQRVSMLLDGKHRVSQIVIVSLLL